MWALAPAVCLSLTVCTPWSSLTPIVQYLASPNSNLHILRVGLLHILRSPNVAVLLILTGIFLIYAELNRPGTVLLGCCGTFAVLVGIYGFAQHPIRLSSLLLLLTGLALLLLELKARTHNLLAFAVTAVIIYSLCTLTRPRVHPLVSLATGTVFTAVTLLLLRISRRARQNKRLRRNPAPNLQPSPRALAE